MNRGQCLKYHNASNTCWVMFYKWLWFKNHMDLVFYIFEQ